jgi:hypothetical protein
MLRHELRTTTEGTVLYRNYRISNGIADRAHLYKVCRYGNAAKQQKVCTYGTAAKF